MNKEVSKPWFEEWNACKNWSIMKNPGRRMQVSNQTQYILYAGM